MRITRFARTLRAEDLHEINELHVSDEELKIIEDALLESRWRESSLRLKIKDYMRDHRITVKTRA